VAVFSKRRNQALHAGLRLNDTNHNESFFVRDA
jgi:hypothetical protein